MRIIAYTYCADHHCPDCARKAGMDSPDAIDREGNTPGVVFATDETPEGGIVCCDCGGTLEAPAGTLRAYTLSELRDRASLSADHADGYKTALDNVCWRDDEDPEADDDVIMDSDAAGHTFDAFGNALDGHETLSDYSPDDQAKLIAMQEGGAS